MSNVIFVSRELLDKLCNANSCQLIMQDKVKSITRHNNKDYVVIGSMGSGEKGNIAAYAYECVVHNKYTGELKPLCSVDHHLEVQAHLRERGYNGRIANHKGKQYVLFGQQITFKAIKESKTTLQQLSLFR